MSSPDMERVGSTGLWTAAIRARESVREDALFVDPLTAHLARSGGSSWIEHAHNSDPQGQEFASIGVVIRTRFFDDFLQQATQNTQIRQVVILATGMDTRAYRLSWPPHTTLFELDQPQVLASKEQLLASASATLNCQRRTIGVDLSQPWANVLQEASFDPGQPSVWLMEGFLQYLPPEAMLQIFDAITSLSTTGSQLGFDVVNQDMFTSPWTRTWVETLKQAGVPWRSFLDQPETTLAERGWQATVVQPGDPSANYGRWPFPAMPDRSVPGMPRNFLVTAMR